MARIVGVSTQDNIRAFELPEATGIFETWAYAEAPDYNGLAIDLEGNSIVCGSSLKKLDSNGTEIWDSGALGFITRSGAVDADGNIFVAHDRGAGSSNTSVSKYDPDGVLVTRLDAGASGRAIFVGPDGSVYLAHNRNNVIDSSFASVRKINNDLDTIEFSIDSGNHARNIHVADGKIYVVGDSVADTGLIHRYSSLGVLEDHFGPVETCNAVIADEDGNMFAGGLTSFDFVKYDSEGNVVWTYATTSALISCDFDSDGNIYLALSAGTPNQGFMVKLNSAGVEQWKTQKSTDTGVIYFDVRTDDSPRLAFGSGGGANRDSMFLMF